MPWRKWCPYNGKIPKFQICLKKSRANTYNIQTFKNLNHVSFIRYKVLNFFTFPSQTLKQTGNVKLH